MIAEGEGMALQIGKNPAAVVVIIRCSFRTLIAHNVMKGVVELIATLRAVAVTAFCSPMRPAKRR